MVRVHANGMAKPLLKRSYRWHPLGLRILPSFSETKFNQLGRSVQGLSGG